MNAILINNEGSASGCMLQAAGMRNLVERSGVHYFRIHLYFFVILCVFLCDLRVLDLFSPQGSLRLKGFGRE